jgi:cell division protein FtsB
VQRWFGRSRGVTWGAVFIVIMLSLLLVRPLAMSLLSWQRTASLLNERRAEVAELQTRNDNLERQLAFYETDAFIAEQARSYGMVTPGEQSFVVREFVHPDTAARAAIDRLRNVTVDHPIALEPASPVSSPATTTQ